MLLFVICFILLAVMLLFYFLNTRKIKELYNNLIIPEKELDNKLALYDRQLTYNTELSRKYEKYNYVMKIITLVSGIILITMLCFYVLNSDDFSFITKGAINDTVVSIKTNVQKGYSNFIDSLKPIQRD